MSGCEKCQRTKTFPAKPFGLLSPNPIPEHNWQFISVDLITQLPMSKGNDAILVVVDQLSKMIRLTPTNKELSLEGLARLYRDRVWQDFGVPERVISDWGSQFTSNFMRDLNRLLGIKANLSTAYHPQTVRRNKLIRRLNSTFVYSPTIAKMTGQNGYHSPTLVITTRSIPLLDILHSSSITVAIPVRALNLGWVSRWNLQMSCLVHG